MDLLWQGIAPAKSTWVKLNTEIWSQISYGNTALPLATDLHKNFKPTPRRKWTREDNKLVLYCYFKTTLHKHLLTMSRQ